MCDAWKAPIMYHSSRDGLGMHLLNTYLEIVDIYGLFILAFVFTTAIVYYRNNIYNIFTLSSKVVNADNNSNLRRSKILSNGRVSYISMSKLLSNIMVEFKNINYDSNSSNK